MLRIVGASTLRSYRQSGITTRLVVGSSILALLILAVSLASLSLGPVNVSVGKVTFIVLSFFGLDVGDFGRTE